MIRALCSRALLLSAGSVVRDGTPGEIIDAYLDSSKDAAPAQADLATHPRSGGDQVAIREAWVENEEGKRATEIFMGRPFSICFRFEANRRLRNAGFGFGVENTGGQRLFSLSNYLLSPDEQPPVREGTVRCRFTECPLLPGEYLASLSIIESQTIFVDYVERSLSFTVLPDAVFASGRLPTGTQGLVYVRGTVSVNPEEGR
jgi:hypothetical protein